MKSRLFGATALLTTALTLGVSTPGLADVPLVNTDQAQLNLGGRLKVTGYGEYVIDPAKSYGRMYLFQNQSRLWLDAKVLGYRVFSQWAFGGEDLVEAPNPGVGLSLLDMNVEIPILAGTLKVGQFKVPYGREQLTDTGLLQFNSRSIGNLGVQTGRDVGLAWLGKLGALSAIGGVFTGGGRDVPPEFIPEDLGVPMLAARVGYGDVDAGADPFRLSQHRFTTDHPSWGVFANGLFMKDSLIGHASIMNVKQQDNSLLTNVNWNPFLARAPLSQGELYQAGLDWAYRAPLADKTLSAEAELDYAGYANSYGSLHLPSGHGQIGVFQAPFELALRYGFLMPDAAAGIYDATSGKTYTLSNGAPIHEITPAISYFLHGDQLKLTLDFPILINMPVVTEPNVGSYVMTDMPNQANPLKSGGTVSNQIVPEARLSLQAAF